MGVNFIQNKLNGVKLLITKSLDSLGIEESKLGRSAVNFQIGLDMNLYHLDISASSLSHLIFSDLDDQELNLFTESESPSSKMHHTQN